MDSTSFRILDSLSRNPGRGYSINGLGGWMKELGYTAYYKNVYDRVMGLNRDGLLMVRKMGNTSLVSLDFESPRTIDELAVMEFTKKKRLLEARPEEGEFMKDVESTPNTISTALLQPERNFRLNAADILYLAEADKAESILTEARKQAGKHNKAVYSLVLTPDELEEMLESKEHNRAKELLKDKVVLTNPAEFWKTVSHAKIRETEGELNPQKITKPELNHNLSRFGYTALTSETAGKKMEADVETTITSCLLAEDARVREATPVLLAKNNVNYRLLLYLTAKQGKTNIAGYYIETTKTLVKEESKKKTLEEALKLFRLYGKPTEFHDSRNPTTKKWGIKTKTTLKDLENTMRLYNAI